MSRSLPLRFPSEVHYDEATGSYVSYIRPLDLYSAATTEEEAILAAQSATDLFLQTAIEKGTLVQVLKETGILSTGETASQTGGGCTSWLKS